MNKPYTVKGSNKVRAYEAILPLYGIHYYIYIGETPLDAGAAATLELGKGFNPEISPNTGAKAITMVHPEKGTSYVVLLGTKVPLDIYMVACHEALHLSWWMADAVGIELYPENHEAQAYILQNIFLELKNAIEEYNNAYKPKTKKK